MDYIGRKVWAFDKEGYNAKINRSVVYTIKEEVRDKNSEGKEFVYGFILDNGKGEEKKVDYYDVVYLPNNELSEEAMVSKYLSDNDICCEVGKEGPVVSVDITWGDWKHEHGLCDVLMSYIDYRILNEVLTEENGSDCYSSIHFYYKKR